MSTTAERPPAPDARLRRRRSLLAVACVLAVTTLWLAGCGRSDDAADTPGFDPQERTRDTTEFTMATTPGSNTTLPAEYFNGTTAAPTAPPTTSTSTTSTTLPEGAAPLTTSDPLCGVVHNLLADAVRQVKARSEGEPLPSVAMSVAMTLGAGADALRALGTYDLAPDARVFADKIDGSTMLIASSETFEDLRSRITALFDPNAQGPEFNRLTERLQSTCPEQLSVFA